MGTGNTITGPAWDTAGGPAFTGGKVLGGPPALPGQHGGAVDFPTKPGVVDDWPGIDGGIALPGVAGGIALPRVDGGIALPRVDGGIALPGVAGGVALPGIAGGIA